MSPGAADDSGHGGALGFRGGGESSDGGEDGGDLDGGPEDHGGEEARAGVEEEPPEVALEGFDEGRVGGAGRVGAADGVGVEERGRGQGLHGEGVAEEQRRREGGRECQERQEEGPVASREEDPVLQEGEEARPGRGRRCCCHGCSRLQERIEQIEINVEDERRGWVPGGG